MFGARKLGYKVARHAQLTYRIIRSAFKLILHRTSHLGDRGLPDLPAAIASDIRTLPSVHGDASVATRFPSPCMPKNPGGLVGLPGELLLAIVSMALPSNQGTSSFTADDYKQFAVAAQTCRRMNRLVVPFMYSRLSLRVGVSRHPLDESSSLDGTGALRKLGRSFKENPHLREHCFQLAISVEARRRLPSVDPEQNNLGRPFPASTLHENDANDIEATLEIIPLLARVRTLLLYGYLDDYREIWGVLRVAVAQKPSLRTVMCYHFGRKTEPARGPIRELFSSAPNLGYLGLHRIEESEESVGYTGDTPHEVCYPRPCVCVGSFGPFIIHV